MVAWFQAKRAGAFPVLGLETEQGELAGFKFGRWLNQGSCHRTFDRSPANPVDG